MSIHVNVLFCLSFNFVFVLHAPGKNVTLAIERRFRY